MRALERSHSIGPTPLQLGETQEKNQWMGAARAEDGRIFSVPRTAKQVLFVEPRTGKVGFLEDAVSDMGGQAYYDAVAATTSCIYGVPFDAPRVLCIDPLSDAVSYIGTDLGNKRFKWGCGKWSHHTARDPPCYVVCGPDVLRLADLCFRCTRG